jgi:hypothetical protein
MVKLGQAHAATRNQQHSDMGDYPSREPPQSMVTVCGRQGTLASPKLQKKNVLQRYKYDCYQFSNWRTTTMHLSQLVQIHLANKTRKTQADLASTTV